MKKIIILLFTINYIFPLQKNSEIYWEITKAPYSKEFLAQQQKKELIFVEDTLYLPEKQTADNWEWVLFWTLQALDVYTTNKGMQYDCVYEANILLPRKPDLNDLVRHKALIFIPAFIIFPTYKYEKGGLTLNNTLTAAVVANNFDVNRRAKANGCKKL